jgi:hypothetical protein
MHQLIAILALLFPSLGGAAVVTLAWDPSGADVAGYRVYYGSASRAYFTSIDVGDNTSCSVSNLVVGSTYFFAVTAYNALGVESDYSGEILYTARPKIQTVTGDENGLTLTWESPPGTLFRVFATQSLVDPVWVDVSGPLLALSGATSWRHARTSSDASMFYRVEVIVSP